MSRSLRLTIRTPRAWIADGPHPIELDLKCPPRPGQNRTGSGQHRRINPAEPNHGVAGSAIPAVLAGGRARRATRSILIQTSHATGNGAALAPIHGVAGWSRHYPWAVSSTVASVTMPPRTCWVTTTRTDLAAVAR
jgi:hypothetical protein